MTSARGIGWRASRPGGGPRRHRPRPVGAGRCPAREAAGGPSWRQSLFPARCPGTDPPQRHPACRALSRRPFSTSGSSMKRFGRSVRSEIAFESSVRADCAVDRPVSSTCRRKLQGAQVRQFLKLRLQRQRLALQGRGHIGQDHPRPGRATAPSGCSKRRGRVRLHRGKHTPKAAQSRRAWRQRRGSGWLRARPPRAAPRASGKAPPHRRGWSGLGRSPVARLGRLVQRGHGGLQVGEACAACSATVSACKGRARRHRRAAARIMR